MQVRIARDLAFRNALLEEGVERCLSGEVEIWKSVLRDYVIPPSDFRRLAG